MIWPKRASPPGPVDELWVAVPGAKMESFTIPGSEIAKGGLAQPRRLLQHCFEHRSEVARRAVDDAQYLGGCGLLLQCLTRFRDQPRVLHCDNRLRGEILQQRDLLVG